MNDWIDMINDYVQILYTLALPYIKSIPSIELFTVYQLLFLLVLFLMTSVFILHVCKKQSMHEVIDEIFDNQIQLATSNRTLVTNVLVKVNKIEELLQRLTDIVNNHINDTIVQNELLKVDLQNVIQQHLVHEKKD
jgi:hypothetical protein